MIFHDKFGLVLLKVFDEFQTICFFLQGVIMKHNWTANCPLEKDETANRPFLSRTGIVYSKFELVAFSLLKDLRCGTPPSMFKK